MGISKTEVNFLRLLETAPQQQNRSKLVHYVATLREQLEQLAGERTPEDLQRVSKAVINGYSEKIEDIASELSATLPNIKVTQEPVTRNSFKQCPKSDVENHIPSSPGLRRRVVSCSSIKDRTHDTAEADTSAPVKLDAAAHAHVQKHRRLQEDLTDEMVGLARQLKVSSLMMSQSLENTEKILDSTEKAVEHSLARTGHADVRAMKIHSEISKTTCFQRPTASGLCHDVYFHHGCAIDSCNMIHSLTVTDPGSLRMIQITMSSCSCFINMEPALHIGLS